LLLTSWGRVQIAVQCWQCCVCSKKGHSHLPGLDSSGLSPRTLERVLDLSIRLPYRESQAALAIQGIELEVSHCERLTQGYGATLQTQVYQTFQELSNQPLAQRQQQHGVKVLQADGVIVMEKDKPSKGLCEGREIKQMLIYPLDTPKERHSIACSDSKQFQHLAHGLLRHAQVQQEDMLIGIADGSSWIDNLFEDLGVRVRILDVYHATSYLETLMLALGWDEDRRLAHRCSWLRGDINAKVWLKHYLPQDPEVWLNWSEEARTALAYLDKRLDQMNYADFKERGYPIGSGQIEGANKSVIGARMKRGGMRWSHDGINRMALLRSQQCSVLPFLDFHTTRLLAFAP
jgi:hypothetical protein